MELESDGNWGSIYVDLDCGADGDVRAPRRRGRTPTRAARC